MYKSTIEAMFVILCIVVCHFMHEVSANNDIVNHDIPHNPLRKLMADAPAEGEGQVEPPGQSVKTNPDPGNNNNEDGKENDERARKQKEEQLKPLRQAIDFNCDMHHRLVLICFM